MTPSLPRTCSTSEPQQQCKIIYYNRNFLYVKIFRGMFPPETSLPPPSSSPLEGGGKGWGCSFPSFVKRGWGRFQIPIHPPFSKGELCRHGSPLTRLALRASVNWLTVSPSVQYGAHYSSHLHPFESLTRRDIERETGFEPATSTLARSHSTAELFPRCNIII